MSVCWGIGTGCCAASWLLLGARSSAEMFLVVGLVDELEWLLEAIEMPAAASSAASSSAAAAAAISSFFLAMRVVCDTTVGSVARVASLGGDSLASGGEGERLKSYLVVDEGV